MIPSSDRVACGMVHGLACARACVCGLSGNCVAARRASTTRERASAQISVRNCDAQTKLRLPAIEIYAGISKFYGSVASIGLEELHVAM